MYEQQTENLYSIIRELRENDFDGVVTGAGQSTGKAAEAEGAEYIIVKFKRDT